MRTFNLSSTSVKAAVSLLLSLYTTLLAAQLSTAPVFADHMVLQRNQPIKIWGEATAGETVIITLHNLNSSTTTNDNGYWEATLAPLPAGGPYLLQIETSTETISYQNVMIGEVWICSGQSNMVYKLKFTANGYDEAEHANWPNIRLREVACTETPQPSDDMPEDDWIVCNPTDILNYSALAYYFGRDLFLNLDIPIGLIIIGKGGTRIDQWISPEGLAVFSDSPSDIMPSGLYNGMIHPYLGLQMAGIIWYQGESDSGSPHYYRNKQVRLIDDWRSQWGIGDFPFIVVQLPIFRPVDSQPMESSWATLRESQTKALKRNNTALVCMIDSGDPFDIHPNNKFLVGTRLSNAARKLVYGEDLVTTGPSFFQATPQASSIHIRFRTHGSSLTTSASNLRGFAIAGEDEQFVWANAELIDNETVNVWHPTVPAPKYVRYAWSDNPGPLDLFNLEGLPALPFRTDKLSTPWE